MTLRGAGVEVDAGRVGRVIVGLVIVALAVLVVVFSVAGADKNAQITNLRLHGVGVRITVTECRGLLGGSGSNGAGYACRGTFRYGAHRYTKAIPGDSLYAPGTILRGVTVPSDPGLISTPRTLASEHASWRVFILPAILLVVLVLLVGALVLRRRHRRPAG
jgi:hypothetical protein